MLERKNVSLVDKALTLFIAISFIATMATAQLKIGTSESKVKALRFVKKKIAAESFESVGVFDINNDKVPDLVSGVFWYEGPDYLKRHTIGKMRRFGQYWDDFSTIPLDVNGDGHIDFITGGWFGKNLSWKENPGDDGEWPEHIIAETGNIETTRAWDIDGDGVVEIVPNTPNDPLTIYRLVLNKEGKGTARFEPIQIFGKHGHGLGFGDINGDGRGDLIVPKGWLEAPEKPFDELWAFHETFELGTAGVPIIVVDVNKDGRNDLIVGQGHDYGLDWYEQQKPEQADRSNWAKHSIDPNNSQFHTMEWTDLDGDGEAELISGKRYRAHDGKDPGSNDAYGLYYYKWNGKHFDKHIISYGGFGETKGTGIYFGIAELTDSGNKDIIVAGKDGLYIFYNKGYE